ncbi:uncharacterized protein A4U43_C07F22710 [Asparagus officinalis]|uniref:RING-type domain-containing protein n=1 Tax=Asparagus officinalis TaxID=4686 RepID=A0A5P1EH50_ASPOF|nr:vacuolar protein sorting-associated protein 8 homolog [Asparagus officinalis]ONK64159.1 uncharacterized protein A4U43_C07F22710 [Asparagus officinalis]
MLLRLQLCRLFCEAEPQAGAALAARLLPPPIPTPHAAAIKNRRAGSMESIQKVESTADLRETGDLSDIVATISVNSEAEEGISGANSQSTPSSSSSVEAEAAVISEEVATEEAFFAEEIESSKSVEAKKEDKLVDLDSLDSTSATIDENSQQIDGALPLQDEAVSSADEGDGMGNQELGREEAIGEQGYDSGTECCGGGELGGRVVEEGDMGDEIDKLVEERLEKLENSKNAEKKRRASMKPLEWAEELERRQASYGLHWEEGAAAQPMRLEGIRRGPPAVGYLQIDLDNAVTRTISSQTFKRDCGSPEVVAVHFNFIAMGTSKGVVLIFPSKYSAQSVDRMDTKMLTLGSHGAKSQTAVTSMCFNQLGDILLVGYGDGSLTFWDVQRATTAKVITGEHNGPVVHTLFFGRFKAITGDSNGIVFLHTISVLPLLNLFSVQSQFVLDGKKNAVVLSASPLFIGDLHGSASTTAQGNSTISNSALGSIVGGGVGGEVGWKLFNEGSSMVEEGLVIFVTHQNALVVRLIPKVEFCDKFSKPDGVREGSMPYTAWKCMMSSDDSSIDASEKASWLVIAWDRRVQVAQLVKSKIQKLSEWSLDSTAIGVAWLDHQMLVVLTLRGQLCLFTKDGSELHRTSFVLDGSGLDDIISYHTHFNNSFGNPEKAYHNSIAVRGATIYIIGPMHLLITRLLPWKERIQVLQRAGDWMGALDMAMRLYDGHAQGVIDLPRNVDTIREAIMPYLVELLLSYVDEVFSYISVAFSNQIAKVGQLEGLKVTDNSVQSEIEEQYARVGGVAVEFCVHIKRTDILFDGIFSKFVAVKHGGTFLEILEPYILKDMLGCLPPEVMQALVEHYSARGWLQRVEQCVLHMDISSLDFNQVVKLCREHGLFGALIYLFNRGLDDFKAPLEELLVVIQNTPHAEVAAIGYRMLIYLKYCFQGLGFPPGHGSLSPSRLPSVRKELLHFLLEHSKSVSSKVLKMFDSLNGNFPNLCYLLLLDTEATLHVLRYAFPEERKVPDVASQNLTASSTESGIDCHSESLENKKLMAQSTVDVFISILDLESEMVRSFAIEGDNTEVWPSKKDAAHLFGFIAFLVICNGATISGKVLKHILEYLTSCDPSEKIATMEEEKQVVSLLKAVPQTEWDSSYVLHLCSKAHFYQACGLVHTISGQYIAALDSYMNDAHEPIHAFAFINSMLMQLKDMEIVSFKSAVISRIPELLKLSRECTYFLVIDHFSSESQDILDKLHSHPQSLFLFLKTSFDVYLSGTLNFPVHDTAHASDTLTGRMRDMPNELKAYVERLSTFPKLLLHNMIQVTDEIAELYLELLCKYEQNSVLKFLENFENYRLEHCLRLCQEYGVTDAAAFLLERAGDVGSALGLVMTGLHDKIDMLITAVEEKYSETNAGISGKTDQFTSTLKMTEVLCVHDVLSVSIGLCQRNSQRLNKEESESLWFRLLDSFSEPLRRFFCGMDFPVEMLSTTSGVQLGELGSLPRWRISENRRCINILRRLFSSFVGEIIEGMVGYVPLPSIMSKLLSDNGNQEFGDFKLTILKMLGTYGYEKRILDTAKSLIEDDTFYTMGLLKKGATHAFVPQESRCCICGGSLSKGSATGIRVFTCGHSTHLHCESEENEASSSNYSSVGCPICLPKKNSRARNKSVHIEDGLVTTSTSISHRVRGMPNGQHAHEAELDKPYVLQQMSRFEILRNLQNPQKSLHVDALPQLRLSPPAIYHEKIQKGVGLSGGETSSGAAKDDKSNKRWQLKDVKAKGSLSRFPLKSSIFGPEKNRVR